MDPHEAAADHAGLVHNGQEPHLLRELMRTSQAALNVFSREVGMPGSRLAVVRLLALSHPEALGPMDLARRLGVNPAAVTRQLQAMEAAGLVVRTPDARDARRCGATLTAHGLAVFGEIHDRGHAFEARLTAEFSPAEIETTTRVLSRVRALLEGLL